MYIKPNLLVLKGNELKTKNKAYGKCFQCKIKL